MNEIILTKWKERSKYFPLEITESDVELEREMGKQCFGKIGGYSTLGVIGSVLAFALFILADEIGGIWWPITFGVFIIGWAPLLAYLVITTMRAQHAVESNEQLRKKNPEAKTMYVNEIDLCHILNMFGGDKKYYHCTFYLNDFKIQIPNNNGGFDSINVYMTPSAYKYYACFYSALKKREEATLREIEGKCTSEEQTATLLRNCSKDYTKNKEEKEP